MTTEQVSLITGATSAIAAAMLQNAPSSTTTLLVPAISAIIGGVMSYAVLKTTVQKMERDVRDMRSDMGEMYSLLRDAMTKIAHMEGRLEHRN
jgi:hypothetical protein